VPQHRHAKNLNVPCWPRWEPTLRNSK
jgi:hypothetical protein